MVAIILGVAGLSAGSAMAPAHANPGAPAPAKTAPKAQKTPKTVKANKTPKAAPAANADHCAIDDLGFDSMLAKKSDAPPPPPKKAGAAVDTIAQSRAAADKFDLGRKSRDATRPTDSAEVKMQSKTLSMATVAGVVAQKQGDLEYCMLKIPEAARDSEEFTLHLTIAAKGAVVEASVTGGDNADKIDECVQAQVKRWTFPQADAPTVIDYALAMHVQN